MKNRALYEDHDPKLFLQSGKELEPTLNKRFSINLPDCSAVFDCQNNYNLMDTNELSWLQKFAQENQKICNSGLFEQAPPVQTRETALMNDMKFSFNMNYQNEERKKEDRIVEKNEKYTKKYDSCDQRAESQLLRDYSAKKIAKTNEGTDNILAEIQNTQNTNVRSRKESLVGSIKKNPKPKHQIIPQISSYSRETVDKSSHNKFDQMSEKLNIALHIDRSAYIQQFNNKQNTKMFTETSMSNLLSSKSSMDVTNNSIFSNTLRQHRIARDVSKMSFDIKPRVDSVNTHKAINPRYDNTSCFEIIFNKLDKSQTGKLSKFNLAVECIPEDLKVIFGGIFTVVKYKQKAYNKRQFAQACDKTIQELSSSEVTQLLRQFEQKQIKETQGIKLFDKNKIPFKASLFQEQQPPKQSLNEKDSIFSLKDNKCNKSNAQICKCGSKIDGNKFYQFANQSSKMSKMSSQSTNKYNQSFKSAKTKEIYYDLNIEFMKKCSQKQYCNSNQKLFQQNQSTTPRGQKANNPSRSIQQDSYNKLNKNINESVLQDHKKSIQSLQKLNQRMQFCLSTNMLAEQSKPGLSQEDSLTFDELIKHV